MTTRSETSWSKQQLAAGVHVVKLVVEGEQAGIRLSTLTFGADATTYDITCPDGIIAPERAAAGQSVSVRADDSVVAGTIIVYDPTTDSRLDAVATADGCQFTMPAHAVEVTALRHPADGQTILANIAATTAGGGSAFARADHPDVWTVDVPATPTYAKAVFTHPYKTHNYNRKNLKLICPDGAQLDVNATYDQPWDVSGHLLPGKPNTFTLTNEHASGIDYWANGIATRAEQLTRLELSEVEVSVIIDALHHDNAGPEATGKPVYDLQGRSVANAVRPGIYLTAAHRKVYVR